MISCKTFNHSFLKFVKQLGFGKSMPTNCVWLDNVDQTVQENFLSRQFGRYGQVTHGIIDRIKGKGLVYFTNAEQAQYALVEMRNRILNNKKIMVSFILSRFNVF